MGLIFYLICSAFSLSFYFSFTLCKEQLNHCLHSHSATVNFHCKWVRMWKEQQRRAKERGSERGGRGGEKENWKKAKFVWRTKDRDAALPSTLTSKMFPWLKATMLCCCQHWLQFPCVRVRMCVCVCVWSCRGDRAGGSFSRKQADFKGGVSAAIKEQKPPAFLSLYLCPSLFSVALHFVMTCPCFTFSAQELCVYCEIMLLARVCVSCFSWCSI